MRVLVLSNVWVEPASSAAGRRMLQILSLFREQEWEVMYASTAKESGYGYNLDVLGITTQSVAINDEGFNAFAKAYAPNIVLFDRFMVEEQFGWRISQECPDALRLLDTEDLHCLRKARQQAVKEGRPFVDRDLLTDVSKREIASIYRCDLTFMISQFEMNLLQDFFKVSKSLLMYLPFLEEVLKGPFLPFKEREHFVSIGNFLHAPNWDATLELKTKIWPLIKKKLPEAQLHVYGAYPSTNYYNDFAEVSIQLYSDEVVWEEAQQNGMQIINEHFQKSDFDNYLLNHLITTLKNIEMHRLANFTGQILQHHTLQSTKYLSKWIEEKNKE